MTTSHFYSNKSKHYRVNDVPSLSLAKKKPSECASIITFTRRKRTMSGLIISQKYVGSLNRSSYNQKNKNKHSRREEARLASTMLTHEHDPVSRTTVLAFAPHERACPDQTRVQGTFGCIIAPTDTIETITFNHLIIL